MQMPCPGCPLSNILGNTRKRVSLNATVDAMNINAQLKVEAIWPTVLSSRPKGMKHTMDDKATLRVQPIMPKELHQAQREDCTIGKVMQCKQCKQSNQLPTLQDQMKAPPDTRSLLREWKLDIGEDGILCTRSGTNLQLLLPKNYFHRTVLRELHEEMRHLGVERVLH